MKNSILMGLAVVAMAGAAARAAETPRESAEFRKYAPDRGIDIEHLTLEVTPDFQQRTVAGKTTLQFKPIARPLEELRLDAVDLEIGSVTGTEAVRSYQVTDKELIVSFARPVPAGKEVRLTIVHSAEPRKGVYFRTPQMGYKAGEAHLFTQGEAIEARHWYPSFDAPNEKFTSEVIAHVPAGMKALSNGRLVSEGKDPATGLSSFRWRQEQPHVNYLISLVVGPFETLQDKYRDIPLAFHVLPSETAQAMNSFRNTRDAMDFFERETGVPYPWAKYDQVCVNDFVAGGMENTSLTSLTDGTLSTDATENIRTSDGLMAHELAHQWFGDLVTTKDWSHLWLNEGFATYYTHLYISHLRGREAMLYGLYNDSKKIFEKADDLRPIVYREFDNPGQQFDFRAYPKGGWILHMLRSQLGEDVYRRGVRTYLERHRFGNVVTENLSAALEGVSGRSLDRFFDQWAYHAHYPELKVKYQWDEKTKMAKLSVAQEQKLSADVLLFEFPLTVRLKSKTGAIVERQVTVREKSEDFYFSLSEAPAIVRVDPDYTLLARIDFDLPLGLLHAQLADKTDMPGRLMAIEQLAGKKDRKTIAGLQAALQGDAFYGVRIEAAKALRKIHTDEAFAALAASMEQPDARARQEIVAALGGFYREETYEALRQVLDKEKNPAILAKGLGTLGGYHQPQVRTILLKYLDTPSYREELADGAIAGLRAQDDRELIAPLRAAIEQRAASFTSRGLGQALDTLAYLARHEEDKDAVRSLIGGYAHSRKPAVQKAALAALGTLEDPKAIPLLQTFAGAAEDSPEREAAEKALAAVRSARHPGDNLKDLREEFLELKKQNQELKKEVEGLRKKVEARKVETKRFPSASLTPSTGKHS